MPKPSVEDLLPSARAALGLAPFETIKLSTPAAHAAFSMVALPDGPPPEVSEAGIMPWEQGDHAVKEVLDAMRATGAKDDLDALAATLRVFSSEDVKTNEISSAEQRGPEWYKMRRFKLSASQVASVVRKSPFQSRRKMLYAKVYPKSNAYNGNSYTAWGTLHEPHAEEAFVEGFLQPRAGMHSIRHCGFVNGSSQLWFGGFSPDGILERRDADEAALEACRKDRESRGVPLSDETEAQLEEARQKCFRTSHELVEYKCSAHHRDSDKHPYAKYWKNIPEHYLIQLQYSMHLARQRKEFPGMERAWLVCWQPRTVYVTHVPYMPAYAASLASQATTFYHKKFVPACLLALKTPGQADLKEYVEEDEEPAVAEAQEERQEYARRLKAMDDQIAAEAQAARQGKRPREEDTKEAV
jgi:hypothetical protein